MVANQSAQPASARPHYIIGVAWQSATSIRIGSSSSLKVARMIPGFRCHIAARDIGACAVARKRL